MRGALRGTPAGALLLALAAAAQHAPPPPPYSVAARIEAPADVAFPGGSEIGSRCRAALEGFGGAVAPRRAVSREDLLAALPPVGAAGWGGGSQAVHGVGDVFGVANASAVLGWLEQLHPGARPSRYHPLDPDKRNRKTAVGVLAEESAEHLLFLFRIHAEFKVSSAPALFVMPGSFEATLRVSRDLGAVLGFDVQVPTDRTFNVLLECGDPFAALGDQVDEAPSSPDARRLSEFKIPFMRREPREWVSETSQPDEPADGGDCEWDLPAETGPSDEGGEGAGGSGCEPQSASAEGAHGSDGSGTEESAASLGPKEGSGEERGAQVESEGASAKMGLQFFPGEDADFFDADADTAEPGAGSREFFLSLQTATQEAHYPAITLTLYNDESRANIPLPMDAMAGGGGGEGQQGKESGPPADWQTHVRVRAAAHAHSHPILASKLGTALYPFLDAGYTTDYHKAFREAAAVGKQLFAVVLWGALDDASC